MTWKTAWDITSANSSGKRPKKGAYRCHTFEEALKGSIEPGKLADLVVLSADYLTVPESEIQRLTALVTMIGGKFVYIDSAARAELGALR